jgi:hypothetical protein
VHIVVDIKRSAVSSSMSSACPLEYAEVSFAGALATDHDKPRGIPIGDLSDPFG